MSDDVLEKQSNTPLEGPGPSENSDKPASSARKSLFGNLNKDLTQALNTWDNLTEQMSNRVSPEEEQLQEVKRLLGELKSKLNEFSE
ncbi:MAG: hypothetical protein OM95_13215 [Bdellovibrio sp. ArHS]|uniref:hypothetical protein n=1 Tax=Bdellovibrio sp. ArHS TaxID=1569284 RepID=UPI000583465F|nr:hypothetical protein [Bdellovibrio sp. ArHS]KHD87650.1 MAG: hypothetical protein OM95_13215 [Bdellovibrio sp. ArHS]